MARLPPSRHPLHCGLRIPDLRARDNSPLNRSCHQGVPAICLTRRLPAQRIRRCGPNATFRTRLQQCDGDWLPLSPRCYRVAHAARLGTDTEICDTVRLGRNGRKFRSQPRAVDGSDRAAESTPGGVGEDIARVSRAHLRHDGIDPRLAFGSELTSGRRTLGDMSFIKLSACLTGAGLLSLNSAAVSVAATVASRWACTGWPCFNAKYMLRQSAGATLDVTEMQPSPPIAKTAGAVASSPDSNRNSRPSKDRRRKTPA